MSPEETPTYWQGRLEGKVEAILETLRVMDVGDHARHRENTARLDALEKDMKEMREWRSYIKGEASAVARGVALLWSFIVSSVFFIAAEAIKLVWHKGP